MQLLKQVMKSAASQQKNKLSLVIDIDGVLIKSRKAIPRAKEGIELIQQYNIPYIFLTNNTSKSQQHKAQEITNYLALEKPIIGNQVVLSFTPFKKLFPQWKDKLILIIGRPDIDDILPLEGFPSYFTINEYVHIFPQSTPLTHREVKDSEIIKEKVAKRLKLKDFDILDLKFDLILALNTPVNWQDSIQIIIDVLSTNDGRVTKKPQFQYHPNHIPIYTSFNDFYFRRQEHPLPRLLMKPFCLALKAVYKEVYGNELQITHYGKPSNLSFQYAHKHIDSLFGQSEQYIMIGDNDDVDIQGAKKYGWNSILVKSGVCTTDSKKATLSCANIEEAVKWIIKENNLFKN